MKCVGNFKYKGITKKDGGSFTNANGQVIEYNPSYTLKVDEMTDNGIMERVFKLPVDSDMIPLLSELDLYQDIEIEFEVTIYSSRVVLTPIAIN